MRCSYCNTEIPDGSRFCPVCGARLSESAPVSAPPASSASDILSGIQANAPAAAAAGAAAFAAAQAPKAEPVQNSWQPPQQPKAEPAQSSWQPPKQEPVQSSWQPPKQEPVQSSWEQPQQPKQESYQPASSFGWNQPKTEPAAPADSWQQPKQETANFGWQQPKQESYTPPASSWQQPQQPQSDPYAQSASSFGWGQQTPKAETYTPPTNNWQQPQQPQQPQADPYAQNASSFGWGQQTQQPQADPYAQGAANSWNPPAQPQGKPLKANKGSKKGLAIGLAAAAVVLIGAVLAFVLLGGKPLPKALKGTQAALNQMLDAGNLGKISSNVEKLGKAGQLTEKMELSAKEGSEVDVKIGFALNADTKTKTTGGTFTVNGSVGEGEKTDFVLRLFADQEGLQAAVDGVDGTYGTTYDALFEKLGVEEHLDMDKITPVTEKDLRAGPLKPVLDSIKEEEVGQTRIVTDGGDKVCKHFVISWDEKEVDKLLKSYEDSVEGFSRDDPSSIALLITEKGSLDAASAGIAFAMSMMKSSQDVYINSNRIIGMDIYAKESESPVYVRLLGKSNVWEHVRLQEASSDMKIDLYWEKGKEIRLCTTMDGEETEILKYNDADGRITVNEDLVGTTLPEIYLKPTDKGAALNVTAGGELLGTEDGKLEATIELAPMAEKPAKLSEDYKDLTKMSDEELQELLGKVTEKLGPLGMMAGSLGGGLGGFDDGGDIWDDGGDIWDDGGDWDFGDGTDLFGSGDADLTPYSGTPTTEQVFGSYDFAYIAASGMTFSAESMGFTDESYVTLWSDGTGVFVWEGESAKINWKINGNKIELTDRDTDSDIYEMIYTQDGNLYIDAGEGTGALVFIRDE